VPERASADAVASARRLFLEQTLAVLIEAIPDHAMVLNEQRQLLTANRRLLRTFGSGEVESLVGLRVGEALGCAFVSEGDDGCGTGRHCATCGAAASIGECQRLRQQTEHECQFTLERGESVALDLLVVSTPVAIDGFHLTVCVLKDVSAEKRRSVLERLFFHDVINTAGGIRGLASLLEQGELDDPQQEAGYRRWLVALSDRLIDEILHQRKLLAAEKGEFVPEPGTIEAGALLREVRTLFASHEVAEGVELVVVAPTGCWLESDAAILRRILGNLVKNALEASSPGDTVTIAAEATAAGVVFSVHNPGVMPREVQLQLFRRSFSTKGESGRGIGTYSVRLFAERYLRGEVAFTSREPDGTTFTVTLPRCLTPEVTVRQQTNHNSP
jgi:K+-sensing histidine kinase KdpD